MFQVKEQDKIKLKEQLNEVERASFRKKEFRMIVKMIRDPGKRMEKMQEMFTKDLEELKDKEMEMKNPLEGIKAE